MIGLSPHRHDTSPLGGTSMGLDSFPEQVTLRDGASLALTPLQPADSGAVLAFYRALSEEDRQFLRDDVTS